MKITRGFYSICCSLFVVLAVLFLVPSGALAGPEILDKGDYLFVRDIPYGPHERHRADAWLPESRTEDTPVVVLVHGGGFRSGDKKSTARYGTFLARRGYVAFAVNYRLAPDYNFPLPLEDVRRAIKIIRRKAGEYRYSPDKIAMYGGSAGGWFGYMLAMKGEVTCAIGVCSPTDFLREPEFRSELEVGISFMGCDPRKQPEKFEAASPLRFAGKYDHAPILIIHGVDDDVVPFSHGEDFYQALTSVGAQVEFIRAHGMAHNCSDIVSRYRQQIISFLEKQFE